jgi:two-component system phosphate regulon sensor histidine kinase PhoR
LALGGAALAASLAFAGAILVFMDALYYETNARNLRDTALALQPLIGAAGPSAPEGWTPVGYRLTLIDADGTVRYDSHFDPALMDNHRDRPEVAAALAGRDERALRRSDTAGLVSLYIALPMDDGAFRLSMTVPPFGARVLQAALPRVYLPLAIAALSVLAVALFARSLSRAAGRLTRLARSAPLPSGEPRPAMSDTEEFALLEEALRRMAADLTRRAEEAEAEGRRLEGILGGMREAVLAADGRLRLRLVNRRARELFGIADGRADGGKDADGRGLLEAVRSTELEAAARRALGSGQPEETELGLQAGGTRRTFRVFASPLADGVVIVLDDITRLKRLEQIRKDFVANVSHELRTPIQLVKGYAETLLDLIPDTPDAAGTRRGLGVIHRNALSMEALTGDLLTLAALEDAGGERPAHTEQRVRPLLEEAAAQVRSLRGACDIAIDCAEDLSAKLHGGLIVQALINLLDNAVKYANAGPIRARAWRDGAALVIEVADSGPGIPREHLDRIFERFYRADRGRGRDAYGLGLAIVRHIALLHHGTAEAESRAGEGSVFRLKLPIRPPAAFSIASDERTLPSFQC